MREDRALSEVLGYVIVFAIILFSVGLISVSGVASIEDIRDQEQASNAQRAFDVIADNMASIYERNSPSRATEIDLGESELYYGGNVSVEIQVGPVRYFEQLRPVELRPADDTRLVYEAGAVFQTERDGGTMIQEPPLLFSSSRIHAPIVKTTSEGLEGAGGTTVLLRGKATERRVLLSGTDGRFAGDDVIVTVRSPRYEIWERYFEEETALSGCSTDASTETVECRMTGPDVVYVTLQQIDISIIL